MFRKTSLKLTALYLSIIMLISLAFSLSIYNVSVRELDRGLRHQRENIVLDFKSMDLPPKFNAAQIVFDNQEQLDASKNAIIISLILVNITILVGGGFVSYYLARRTLKPIEEAHEAQSRFTADASHELRTPIAAMQTEIEVTLMDPNLDIEQAKDQLKSNLEELAGLTSLTESLLSLARLQNNHLDKSNLKLHTLVNSAISRAKPQAAMKSVKVKLSSPKNVLVCADRASLEEAVIIMIDNAIKYSPEKGQVDITIAKDTKSVKISVKDSGPGISDADLPHIFDRFYRSDTARTKNENNGYGLGLSIAKKIVDLHDGKIFVDSKLGEGSTFTICIPWQKYTS